MPIQVGDEFSTFLAFQEALAEYSTDNAVSTYVWDSQKIQNARKRGIKREMDENLVYYYIKYGCVRGGKLFKARGEGKRDTR